MCRFAAYLGEPAPLSALLYDAPHSLHEQAYRPRLQRRGTVNVDGTGVAWWQAGDPRPLRYVTAAPPWADPNLPSLAPRLRAPAQLAAVRSATPGIPHGPASVAPFVCDDLAAVHNGWLGAFRDGTARALVDALPGDLFAALDSLSDSHALFLTVVAGLRDDPAAGLVGALITGLERAAAVCRRQGAAATLTLAVADGDRCVAANAALDAPANSLFTCHDGSRWPGAAVVASEPLDDDPRWQPVEPGCVVEVTATSLDALAIGDLKGTT